MHVHTYATAGMLGHSGICDCVKSRRTVKKVTCFQLLSSYYGMW